MYRCTSILRAAMQLLQPICIHSPRRARLGTFLGAASNAARAFELDAGGDTLIGAQWLTEFQRHSTAHLRSVLARYPAVMLRPGRLNEMMRDLDTSLR